MKSHCTDSHTNYVHVSMNRFLQVDSLSQRPFSNDSAVWGRTRRGRLVQKRGPGGDRVENMHASPLHVYHGNNNP